MGTSTDGSTCAADDGENDADDGENDAEGGEDADAGDDADKDKDDSGDDHVAVDSPIRGPSDRLFALYGGMSRYPAIAPVLAAEVLDAIGSDSSASVESVTDAFRSWLPGGSTAKWRAVDAGNDPPGADPAEALEARLAGAIDAWSCWPLCTGLGAVLASMGHHVRVAVEHRRDGRNMAPVDHHSVLVVDGALLDPFLGPSAPVPPGHDVVRPDAWSSWVPGARPDHLGVSAGGAVFRYRLVADHLDARDVRAFCAISATHSGVGRRRTMHLLRGGKKVFVREGEDEHAVVQISEGDNPFAVTRRIVATGSFDQLCRGVLFEDASCGPSTGPS